MKEACNANNSIWVLDVKHALQDYSDITPPALRTAGELSHHNGLPEDSLLRPCLCDGLSQRRWISLASWPIQTVWTIDFVNKALNHEGSLYVLTWKRPINVAITLNNSMWTMFLPMHVREP